jgi:hypothetical protein
LRLAWRPVAGIKLLPVVWDGLINREPVSTEAGETLLESNDGDVMKDVDGAGDSNGVSLR